MHINKDHGARAAAWAGAVLAATMGLCAPAGGEPVMHLDGAQPPAGTVGATPGLSAVEALALNAIDPGGNTQLIEGTLAAPRQPGGPAPRRAESSLPTDRRQPDRALVRAGSPPAASPASSGLDLGANEDAQWRRELADTLLEVVLPAYEALAATGMLQAVRSLETELGLNNGPSFDDTPSGVHAYKAGDGAPPPSVGWSAPGDSVEAWIHARSGAQIAEDRRLANLRVRELIEDVKLWALILVALYGLGFLVKVALDYRKLKAAHRRHRRHRSPMVSRRRRHSHHKRRPPV